MTFDDIYSNDYSCNSSDYLNGINRYDCSPSDLSSKYGSIKLLGNPDAENYLNYDIEYNDDLMITHQELEGKSIVLQCKNSYKKVACGKLVKIGIEWVNDDDGSDLPSSTNGNGIESTESMESTPNMEDGDSARMAILCAVNVLIGVFVSVLVFV